MISEICGQLTDPIRVDRRIVGHLHNSIRPAGVTSELLSQDRMTLNDTLRGIAGRDNIRIIRRKIQGESYQSTWSVVCIVPVGRPKYSMSKNLGGVRGSEQLGRIVNPDTPQRGIDSPFGGRTCKFPPRATSASDSVIPFKNQSSSILPYRHKPQPAGLPAAQIRLTL